MGRRVSLPLSQAMFGVAETPTLAAMRKRLGGRATGAALLGADGVIPVGAIVRFVADDRLGVLLAVTDDSIDVYMSEGIVKRTRCDLVAAHRGPSPLELGGVAEAAAIFGRLAEEDSVLVERGEGAPVGGRLVEKCRYGALVEIDGGVVLAVGFRKIWPTKPTNQFQN